MSAPTNAPVLAVVVPGDWIVVRSDGEPIGFWRPTREHAEATLPFFDEKYPKDAPHTVQQLARVVRVVAVDDAMVERAAQSLHELCDSWRLGTTAETWGALPDESKAMRREQARAALAAAFTPPEA